MEILKNSLFDNQKIKKQKLGLKLKLTITTCVAAFIFLAVLISIMYMFGFNELKDKAVEKNKEMARILAASVDSAIENQVELIRVDAKSLFLIDAAKAANLKYGTKNEKEALRYLMDVDKRWLDAPSDHPLLKEYLENQASLALKEKTREKETTASIIATDKFGGLIASTYRPSGFYSFDQDWWKSTSANGEGKPFVGNVEYDEFSKAWCLPIAVPIKDELGAVIGAYKTMVDINLFFSPLRNFKIEKTGNAVIADDKAYLVYDRRVEPFTNKFCEYDELKKILQDENRWGMLSSAYAYNGKTLVAYSKINLPISEVKGIQWYVFVEQDLKEVLSPLDRLMLQMVIIGMILLIILALLVFILNGEGTPSYSLLQVFKESAPAKVEKTEEKEPSEMRSDDSRLPGGED